MLKNKNDILELVKNFQNILLSGDFIEVKKYIKKHNLDNIVDFNNYKNNFFFLACLSQNIEIVDFLLTSNEISHNINLLKDENYGFNIACFNGSLDIVKYLLTSEKLSAHVDMSFDNYYCLINAFSKHRFEVINYLLTSPDLKKHADIHANNDAVFQKIVSTNNVDMLNYFICELNVIRTKNMDSILKKNKEFEALFNVKYLAHHLSQNKTYIKKSKI